MAHPLVLWAEQVDTGHKSHESNQSGGKDRIMLTVHLVVQAKP